MHSKVMAWVAADRMAKMAEATGIEAKSLAQMRDDIHESEQLDAALLLIPQVGFLPPSDPRVAGTVDAIRRQLVRTAS